MWLRVKTDGGEERSVEVTGDTFAIGRDEECDLVLEDDQVSRRHAELELSNDRIVVRDLGSRNGTFVNGKRIQEPTPLEGNEQLRVGNTVVSLSPSKSASTVSAGQPTKLARATPPAPSPAPPPTPFQSGPTPRTSQSRIERLTLQRSARRAMVVAVIALGVAAVAIAAGVLFATGVLDTGNDEASVGEIIKKVSPSTVSVRISGPGQRPIHNGTGWVLDADEGLVVTNAHVVNGGARFAVALRGTPRRAQLIGVAPCDDLAVLKVDDVAGLEETSLGSQGDLEQGDQVIAVGFPTNASLEAKLVATTGVVSQVSTPWRLGGNPELPRYPNLIQTDAVINPGNSGGPLVDHDGRLVGVNTATIRGTSFENYAIGVDRVKEVVEILREGHGLAWTGMNFEYIEQGIAVRSVVPGTPADSEGLGDVDVYIAGVNGQPVKSLQGYCKAIGDENRAGDSANFVVVPIEGDQAGQPGNLDIAFK